MVKTRAKPLEGGPILRAISLGAGIQSTTLALMAAHGLIDPMPDCAIFADTHAEPTEVYQHIEWLSSSNVLPFPVHVVDGGNLREDLIQGLDSPKSRRFASIPYFIRNADGSTGIGVRGCTLRYKIEPLMQAHRKLLGFAKGKNIRPDSVEVWIGISRDEMYRIKEAKARWQTNRFPLIEKRMTRQDCITWLRENDYPIPTRSACAFCPYHSDAEWKRIRRDDPAAWQNAVDLDRAIRERGNLGLHGTPYLHRSLKPLSEAELDGGMNDLFDNDCDGLCGV
ncbi:hypothetical protein [Acetobacter indonesiensis]|uniref:Phosphoadenosine phosphosulphate reductase domain-containing protein n=1 Tax=Acetobacter indonesiensis TaxID=104101 RepID=A0A252AS35_9PROT|nr:hypothetical protein [Acetobacter indonesiensis]OUI92850.1 hypothetical protein HK17_09680 [Acetobacter indonesiensis]